MKYKKTLSSMEVGRGHIVLEQIQEIWHDTVSRLV